MLSKPGFSRLWEENKQIKKVNDPYFREKKNSCELNLHKQMHVQRNCVNSRECMVGDFGRLCWKMSVVVQNGQWGGQFSIPWDLRLH